MTDENLDMRMQVAQHQVEIDVLSKAVNGFIPLAQQVTEVRAAMVTMQRDIEKMLERAERKSEADREALAAKSSEDQQAYSAQKRLVWSLGVTLFVGLAGILTAILSGSGHP